MKPAPIMASEDERLKLVHDLHILDTKPDAKFDALTAEAVRKLGVPMATVTIIDKDREWFKSCQGMTEKESPREISFCGHAMYADDIFVVEDTLKNPDFADNPMVVNPPHIRFYAGIALRHHGTGLPLGVFCIKDTKPRKMTVDELGTITDIAMRAEQLVNDNKE